MDEGKEATEGREEEARGRLVVVLVTVGRGIICVLGEPGGEEFIGEVGLEVCFIAERREEIDSDIAA